MSDARLALPHLPGCFSVCPPAFSTPPPSPGCIFPSSWVFFRPLRLLFRLSGSLSIFPLAFLLPPTDCSSLLPLPPPPAAFLFFRLLFHLPRCSFMHPLAFPPSRLLSRLSTRFSIPTLAQLLFHPPSPAVCFSAFPAALPFPSTTTSCFSIFLATFTSFCLIFFAFSHTHVYRPQLLFHLSNYFPIPPHPFHQQVFQAQWFFYIFSCSFSTTTTSLVCSAILLLLFNLLFPSFWLLFHPFHLLFHVFQLLFHSPCCSSMLLTAFPSFFPSMPLLNLLLHHLTAPP